MSEIESTQEEDSIGAYWSQRIKSERPKRWMQHPWVVRKVNDYIGGIDSGKARDGLKARVRIEFKAKLPFRRGISVACGNGGAELDLVREGLVREIDAYELSEERIRIARSRVRTPRLQQRVRFHCADAFQLVKGDGEFDLVHWNNALHHMSDTAGAIRWSKKCLRRGGVFYMDDYVGADRFQHSDALMDAINRIRAELPERVFQNSDRGPSSRTLSRVDANSLMRVDPSEAVDSSRILPAITETFRAAKVIPVSSGLLQQGLKDVLPNLHPIDDAGLLEDLWKLDHSLIQQGHISWAVVLAENI